MKVYRISKTKLFIEETQLLEGANPQKYDGELSAYREDESDALNLLFDCILAREIEVSNQAQEIRKESANLYKKRIETINRLELLKKL